MSQEFSTVTSYWAKTRPSLLSDTALDDTFQLYTKPCVFHPWLSHTAPDTRLHSPRTHVIQHVGSSDNRACSTIFGGPKASSPSSTDSVAQWHCSPSDTTTTSAALHGRPTQRSQWHCSPSDTTTTSAALHGAVFPSFSVTPSIGCCAHPHPGPPLAHCPFSFALKYSKILSSPILKHNIVCSY